MKINTKVNTIPSLTWNWLKANSASLIFEKDYKLTSKADISKLPGGIIHKENNSAYVSKIRNIDSGMGKTVSNLLTENCIEPDVFIVEPYSHTDKPVIINFELKDKHINLKNFVIDAKENSKVTVICLFESSDKDSGFNALLTKLYARKNSYIHFITVQLTGRDYINCDDIGAYCEENAKIEVTQIILGGKQTFTGTHCLLNEYKAAFKSDLAYICKDSQELDMNFVVKHTGRKTDCLMNVRGTLKDKAKKTYRGTIDFQNGCAGATGNEMEEVFLTDPLVTNKSIPVILCDEEDVEGEHGATIGKLDKNTAFYMNSRGISTQEAQKIISQAKIKYTSDLIPDSKIQKKITEYCERLF